MSVILTVLFHKLLSLFIKGFLNKRRDVARFLCTHMALKHQSFQVFTCRGCSHKGNPVTIFLKQLERPLLDLSRSITCGMVFGYELRRVDLSVWSRRPTAVSFVMCRLQASLPTVFCSSSHSEMLAELKVHIVDFLLVCVKRVFLLALCCIFT